MKYGIKLAGEEVFELLLAAKEAMAHQMDSLTLPCTHTHTAAVARLSCILDSIHGRLSEQGLCFFQVEFSNFVLKYLLTRPMCLPHRFLQGSVEMRRS